jgi:hypothetical protein
MGGKRGRGERSTPAQTYSGGGERAGMEPKRGKTKMGCRETLGGNNVWVGGHVSELFFLRSGLGNPSELGRNFLLLVYATWEDGTRICTKTGKYCMMDC